MRPVARAHGPTRMESIKATASSRWGGSRCRQACADERAVKIADVLAEDPGYRSSAIGEDWREVADLACR